MKVIVPYTSITPATKAALDSTGHEWEPVYVGDDDTAYWELLNDLWAEGDGFIIVEHDIVVQPDSLSELENCQEAWCSFGSPYLSGDVYHGLGCVKFSAALISRYRNAMATVAEMHDATHPRKHWCRLDAWLQGHALQGAYRHHHATVLAHAKESLAPSHGCI